GFDSREQDQSHPQHLRTQVIGATMESVTVFDMHTRTRVPVPYEFTPGVDYWAKIESQCPAWRPQQLADTSAGRNGSGRAVTWDHEDSKTRSMMILVDGREV